MDKRMKIRTAALLPLVLTCAANVNAQSGNGCTYDSDTSVLYCSQLGRLTRTDWSTGFLNVGNSDPCDTGNGDDWYRDTSFMVECGADLNDPYLSRELHVRYRPRCLEAGARKGHITFAIGGTGDGFYELASVDDDPHDTHPCPQAGLCDDGGDTIAELVRRGYDTYQINHVQVGGNPPGRFYGARGLSWEKLACTYALVIEWIDAQRMPGEAVCSTGNSGGSFEIAYGLAYHGLDTILDAAVLTGGPITRWDLHAFGGADCVDGLGNVVPGCNGLTSVPTGFVADPREQNGLLCWSTAYGCGNVDHMVFGSTAIDCDDENPEGPACTYRTCKDMIPDCTAVLPSVAQVDAVQTEGDCLEANDNCGWMNIVPGAADLSYPWTRLRFVQASNDPSKAQNFARIYADDVLKTADDIQFTNIGRSALMDYSQIHSIHLTEPGSDKIVEYLDQACHRPRGMVESVATTTCADETHTLTDPCTGETISLQSSFDLDLLECQHLRVDGPAVENDCSVRDVQTYAAEPFACEVEVRRLSMVGGESTWLDWTRLPCMATYDVIRGTLPGPFATAGQIDLGNVICLAEDTVLTDTSANPDSEIPSAGTTFFYLVRATGPAGVTTTPYGVSSSGLERIPGSGDCAQ